MSTQTYHLPDLFSLLPKKPGPEINPHFKEAEDSFHAWVQNTLSGDYATVMAECDAPMFFAMLWPKSSYEWLVGVSNWGGAAFVLDDLMESCPKEEVPALVNSWLDSLDGKQLEHPVMGVILNDLVPSMRTALGPYHWPRLVRANKAWLLHAIQEAHGREAYRNKDTICDIQEHLKMRRGTSGAFSCFTFTQSNRCLYIPEDVLAHPVIEEISNAIADVLTITNDIYSFEKEYKFDKAFANVLTVIQRSESDEETSHLDMQGALDYSGKLVEAAMEHFHARVRDLPSFNPEIDAYLVSYVEGMIDMIVGNVQWSRVSRRYNAFANEEDKMNNVVRWAL